MKNHAARKQRRKWIKLDHGFCRTNQYLYAAYFFTSVATASTWGDQRNWSIGVTRVM